MKELHSSRNVKKGENSGRVEKRSQKEVLKKSHLSALKAGLASK